MYTCRYFLEDCENNSRTYLETLKIHTTDDVMFLSKTAADLMKPSPVSPAKSPPIIPCSPPPVITITPESKIWWNCWIINSLLLYLFNIHLSNLFIKLQVCLLTDNNVQIMVQGIISRIRMLFAGWNMKIFVLNPQLVLGMCLLIPFLNVYVIRLFSLFVKEPFPFI